MSFAVASRRVRKGLTSPFISLLPRFGLTPNGVPQRLFWLYTRFRSPAGAEADRLSSGEWHPHVRRLSVTNELLASMVLTIWLYLLVGRGGFWLTRERDEPAPAAPRGAWPSITAVIPARDEAECVGDTIISLLRQDYSGEFRVILVDDQSRDGTAEVARDAAAAVGGADRLSVLTGQALPAGWTG